MESFTNGHMIIYKFAICGWKLKFFSNELITVIKYRFTNCVYLNFPKNIRPILSYL